MRSAGRVLSVNVAVVRADPFTRVASGLTGIDKLPADGEVRLEADGVAGDTVCDTRYHGGPDQAVYAYAAEDLAFWSAELGRELVPGGVGENLTLVGVDCTGAVVSALAERTETGSSDCTVDAESVARGNSIDAPRGARIPTVMRNGSPIRTVSGETVTPALIGIALAARVCANACGAARRNANAKKRLISESSVRACEKIEGVDP